MVLKLFFDISTSFRFSEISVECPFYGSLLVEIMLLDILVSKGWGETKSPPEGAAALADFPPPQLIFSVYLQLYKVLRKNKCLKDA